MRIKRELRELKESKYKETNESRTSICSGYHYIKQTHKHERCKHCDGCYKYFLYKNNKSATINEVKFHYVDSFRECKLYGQKIEKPSKDSETIITENKVPQNVYKAPSRAQLAAEAYFRFEKKYPELLSYITWSELFAICIMKDSIEEMNKVVINSKVYKREFKQKYNRFYSIFKKYINEVYANCFYGDSSIVENEVRQIDIEIAKFRYTIENYINKYKVGNSEMMSHIILCNEIMAETERIHFTNQSTIKKKERDMIICEFMSPTPLLSAFKLVISQAAKLDNIQRQIDLNDDFNIINGVKVLHNKIRNGDTIARIIRNVYLFHKKRKEENGK